MITTLPVQTQTSVTTSIIPEKRELVWNHSRSMAEIVSEIETIQDKCEDFVAKPLSQSFFSVDSNGAYLNYEDTTGCLHSSSLSQHSLSQLCVLAGVPTGYIRKCIAEDEWGRKLAEDNINKWLENSTIENSFMRQYDGEHLRGILSSRYACYDAPNIVNLISESVDFEQFDVVGSMVNEERLHLRIINKHPLDVKSDKDLCWGFFVDTSDVGRSSVSITVFIWKQACTNGLIIPVSRGLTFTHVHRGFECDFSNGIMSTIEKAPSYVDEMVALIDKASDKSVHAALLSRESLAHEKLAKTIKAHSGLSDKGVEQVFYYLEEGLYPPTLWGVVNAMTEAAQKYNLEKRIDIEKGAGRLLMTA